MEDLMNRKRLGLLGVIASAALAISATVVPAAHAASEILIWADETRGPHLTTLFAANPNVVPGSTIKVVTFSSYDALGAALDKVTGTTGPDIFVGGNDWVTKMAKSGKLAPVTLTATQKSKFAATNFFDLSYQGKLYGVPVDINNVAMVYNTKLVTTAPKTYGDMVDFYKANKVSKGLKAGLCITGGGMAWGGLSGLSALGADPYFMRAKGVPDVYKGFNGTTFGNNVKKYLLDANGKSNGFYPATDTGCADNFKAGLVPYATIGNWEWKTYEKLGFTMNFMPVPGVVAGTYGHMFGSVNGAFLTTYADKHGVAVAAKSLLTNYFASAAGQIAYEAIELRPPANLDAQSSASVSDAQKNMANAATLAGIPQIGAFLGSNAGGASYWDSSGGYWTAVLVNGKDPVVEGKKLAAIWKKNVAVGKADL